MRVTWLRAAIRAKANFRRHGATSATPDIKLVPAKSSGAHQCVNP
jgi:hypothetical protein